MSCRRELSRGWASGENSKGEKGKGGQANGGRKGSPTVAIKAGESRVLAAAPENKLALLDPVAKRTEGL